MATDSNRNQAALLERADAVVASASAHMTSLFPNAFDECVSLGLNGSCARGDLSAVSDIDYCVIFDCRHEALSGVDLPASLAKLQRHVADSFPAEPFAKRFSIFWASLQDLKAGSYRAGRFPSYDRGLYRQSGKHVAGLKVRESIRSTSALEICQDGVKFLLDEVRPQLAALRFFQRLDESPLAQVQQLGAVLTTKVVLMPVRLLYVLSDLGQSSLFVGVEAAVRACMRSYSAHGWLQLADAALHWRHSFPEDEAGLTDVGQALKASVSDLYRCCVESHRQFALTTGMLTEAEALGAWLVELA